MSDAAVKAWFTRDDEAAFHGDCVGHRFIVQCRRCGRHDEATEAVIEKIALTNERLRKAVRALQEEIDGIKRHEKRG